MKKVTLLSVFFSLVLLLSGCDNMTVTTGDGSEKVQGDGKMTTSEREAGSFNRIELQGVFNLYLTQGGKEAVKVEAEENVMPLVQTSIEGNVLKIKLKDDVSLKKVKKINVYVTFVDLSEISSEGVGMLMSTGHLKFRDLLFSSKGVGATKLDLEAEKLTIRSEIVGAMFLKGKVTEASIEHKGVGAIQAFDLQTDKMTFVSEGIGSAEISASKELNVRSSG
ncbi:MAG: head GIN domain-containing protein [Bacteroidia bacterium]